MNLKKKRAEQDLDERQEIEAAKGCMYGFYTILAFSVFDLWLYFFVNESVFEPSIDVFLGVFLGLFVMMEYSIWKDAAFGLHGKPVAIAILLFFLAVAFGLVLYLFRLDPSASISVEGKMDLGELLVVGFILYLLIFLTDLARLIYVRIRDRE